MFKSATALLRPIVAMLLCPIVKNGCGFASAIMCKTFSAAWRPCEWPTGGHSGQRLAGFWRSEIRQIAN